MANNSVLPIRMDVKFRNNIILQMMEDRGIKSNAELSRQTGVSQSVLSEIINMKMLPSKKDGRWSVHVIKLAEFFYCLPEDMFSEEQLYTRLSSNHTHVELTFGEMYAQIEAQKAEYMLPENVVDREKLKGVVEYVFKCLTPIEQKVISLLFGFNCNEYSEREVASIMGVGKLRIRHIGAKALRKLRHPDRTEKLYPFLETENA